MIKFYILFFILAVIYFALAITMLSGLWIVLGFFILAICASAILKYLRAKYGYKGIAPAINEDPYKDIDELLTKELEEDAKSEENKKHK